MFKKLETKKNLLILIWVFFGSFVVWGLTFIEGWTKSYMIFTALFFISGYIFHFFMEMIQTPINSENSKQWNLFGKRLLICALILSISIGSVAFEKFIYPMGGTIVFCSLFLIIFPLSKMTDKTVKTFYKIKE